MKQTAVKPTGGKTSRMELATKEARKAAPTDTEARRRRFRPSTVSSREIRKLQKSTNLLISKDPFERAVFEVAQGLKADVRFQAGALEALQHTTEAFFVELFEEAQVAAIHAKRVNIQSKDIKLAIRIHVWDKNILMENKTKE